MARNRRKRKAPAGTRSSTWLQAAVLLLFLIFLILFVLGRLRGSLPHTHPHTHSI